MYSHFARTDCRCTGSYWISIQKSCLQLTDIPHTLNGLGKRKPNQASSLSGGNIVLLICSMSYVKCTGCCGYDTFDCNYPACHATKQVRRIALSNWPNGSTTADYLIFTVLVALHSGVLGCESNTSLLNLNPVPASSQRRVDGIALPIPLLSLGSTLIALWKQSEGVYIVDYGIKLDVVHHPKSKLTDQV